MQCYICESQPRPTAALMRVVSQPAVGVCRQCGIGVCMRHGHRASAPGAPLLCGACARIAAQHRPSMADVDDAERTLAGAW